MHNAIYMQIYLIFIMKVSTISIFPRLESMLHYMFIHKHVVSKYVRTHSQMFKVPTSDWNQHEIYNVSFCRYFPSNGVSGMLSQCKRNKMLLYGMHFRDTIITK